MPHVPVPGVDPSIRANTRFAQTPVWSVRSRSIPTPDARSQSSRMSSIRVIWQNSNTRWPFARSAGSNFDRSCILPLEVRKSVAGSGSRGNVGSET